MPGMISMTRPARMPGLAIVRFFTFPPLVEKNKLPVKNDGFVKRLFFTTEHTENTE
jgi:hypothetical protein